MFRFMIRVLSSTGALTNRLTVMTRLRLGPIAVFVALGGLTFLDSSSAADARLPRQRQFQFTYAVSIAGLEAGQRAKLWVPVPPNNDEQ
jgi:hypothetical protein